MKKGLLIFIAIVIAITIPTLIYILIVGLLDYLLKPHNNLQLCLFLSFFPTIILYPLIVFPMFNIFVYLFGEKTWNGYFKISNRFDDVFQLFSLPWLFTGMYMPILIFILIKVMPSKIILCLVIGIFAGALFPIGNNILRSLFRYKEPYY